MKGNAVKDWCRENGIVSVITRQHAAVAERAIRTIKKRISDKLQTSDVEYPDKGPESLWTKHVQEAVDWYNKENVQATTNMKTGRSGKTRKRIRRKNKPRDKRYPPPKVSCPRGG